MEYLWGISHPGTGTRKLVLLYWRLCFDLFMSTSLSRRAFLAAFQPDLIVNTAFPGGSLGHYEVLKTSHIVAHVAGQSDQDGRNRQANWYYFEVRGASQLRELMIDLVGLPGEYNYQPNQGAVTKDTRPHILIDGHWQPCDGEFDEQTPKWRLKVSKPPSSFRIAHIAPYLERDLRGLRKATRPQVSRIGRTVKGRNLELWTFNGQLPASAPVVWLMFRQHAWESGTSWTADGMLRQLSPGIVWKVLPLCDPDGVANGGVRFNQHGFDLNRNWDSPDDLHLRPEITYQRAAIAKWLRSGRKIDLFLTLHNTETSEYLEGPPDGIGPKLFAALKSNSRFAPTRDYFTRMEWQGKGRANVIQYLWTKHKIAACLMELRVAGVDHKNWIGFGPELAKSIAQSLS